MSAPRRLVAQNLVGKRLLLPLILQRVLTSGISRYRQVNGKGGITLTKSTASKPDKTHTSVVQVQDMDKEERRRYVEYLGREIANWSAELNRRLA